jgi:hypothetical protein
MTTLFVDGVHIVFEGVARLRWAAGPWMLNETASHQAVLESVWPGRDLQVYLRRQIEHGQKTLVIVDDREPILRLPLQRAPRVPFGVVDLGGDRWGERCLLIPRFNWLSDRDRLRGESFLDHFKSHRLRSGRRAECDVGIERGLVGTREPVRFVFVEQEMSLRQIQRTIENIFRSDPPVVTARPGNGYGISTAPGILAA